MLKKLSIFIGLIILGVLVFACKDAVACYYDYSDASPGYGTAYHKIRSSTTSWQWFGNGISSEEYPRVVDTLDDGFTFSEFVPGQTGWIKFTAHSRRKAGVYEQIRVWIDWNQNRVFDPYECVKHQAWKVPYENKTLTEIVYFTVPTTALFGQTWLRARICCQNHLQPTGYRSQGEVEDYQVDVVPEPATMLLLGSLATGLFGIAGIRRKQ